MTTQTTPPPGRGFVASVRSLYARATDLASWAEPVGLLAMRLLLARVFLNSGLTKWDGLSVSNSAYSQFEVFYGNTGMSFFWIDNLARITAVAEIVLPALLVLGLFGRVGAFGLLTMTFVIQLTVCNPDYNVCLTGWDDWWNVHAWWAAIALYLAVRGPGGISLDRVLGLERSAGAR
ncbi:DoxX family protein [Rhodovibrio sodomensis]|nr:DoxX family protein [Rhodovibrio sodomensis]